ncbi:MAG: hypothetical protein ABWJ90_07750 [Thermus sp.]|uniref:Uncharacterized protein n=1 Tax=Thermus brockianus TaxID=56956 RepID=A0ABN6NGA8_THEBO|nr:hypothetical protein [Thermus brockianus]BDG15440.1 hypothetical protein TbrSNM41_01740 [Thermus brockianus]
MKQKVKLLVGAGLAALPAVLPAFAQVEGFDPGVIASQVMGYIGQIAAAGVGVLALAIGLTAAWRYAKRFLKG